MAKKKPTGQKVSSQVKFEKTTLPCGLRVITERHPDTKAVSCGVWVPVGTRHEPSEPMGLAHFVEHMVFKKTKRRSAYEIARDMEAVGGDLNAYTSRENTCFVAGALKEDLDLSIDVLGDLVTSAVFEKEDIEKEKQVVIQEIGMSEDALEESIFDHYFSQVFKDSSLGRPILGSVESIENLKKSDVQKFYDSYYGADQLIVSIAGNVDHDAAVRSVEKHIVDREPKRKSSPPPTPDIEKWPKQANVFRRAIPKPAEQVHILVGWPTLSFSHDLRFCAYMAHTALGGGMTSRLYQKIREDRGLVYSVYSQLNTFTDSGVVTVYAATERKNAKQVVSLILDEIETFKKKGLTDAELKLFRQQVRGQMLLGGEDIDNRLNSIGINEMVFGDYRSVDRTIKEVATIDHDQMREYFKNHFDVERISVLLMGDVDEK